jgi:hypothetical protein
MLQIMVYGSWSDHFQLLVPEPVQVFVRNFGNVAVSAVS